MSSLPTMLIDRLDCRSKHSCACRNQLTTWWSCTSGCRWTTTLTTSCAASCSPSCQPGPPPPSPPSGWSVPWSHLGCAVYATFFYSLRSEYGSYSLHIRMFRYIRKHHFFASFASYSLQNIRTDSHTNIEFDAKKEYSLLFFIYFSCKIRRFASMRNKRIKHKTCFVRFEANKYSLHIRL